MALDPVVEVIEAQIRRFFSLWGNVVLEGAPHAGAIGRSRTLGTDLSRVFFHHWSANV
jgi:hypothetical protein